jgi:hypothetical protein
MRRGNAILVVLVIAGLAAAGVFLVMFWVAWGQRRTVFYLLHCGIFFMSLSQIDVYPLSQFDGKMKIKCYLQSPRIGVTIAMVVKNRDTHYQTGDLLDLEFAVTVATTAMDTETRFFVSSVR